MSNKITAIVTSAFLSLLLVLPACAQGATFDTSSLIAAGAGTQGNTTATTGTGSIDQAHYSRRTDSQRYNRVHLPGQGNLTMPLVSQRGLAKVFGMVGYPSYSNASAQDYVDSPNLTDTYKTVAAEQAIASQEQANEAQDDANAVGQASSSNGVGIGGMGGTSGF
jgi:hypothetical protein